MSTATLNLRVSPRRMLSSREAAGYCGRTSKRFTVECPVSPIIFTNGDRLYDMRDLDAWLDSLKVRVSVGDDIVSRLA